MKRAGIIIYVVLLFRISFAESDEPVLKKASFIPQWVPQAQFAGYYVAYVKGIYKKYGLDLTIIQGGPNRLPSDFLESGKADFATMWLSTAIQRRAQGARLVNIGQIIQRSALMLIAKKASGIDSPESMNGKKVGVWGADFQIQPRAFFKKYNLEVNVIPQSRSVNLFLMNGVDVVSAMWYNEYHTIVNSGLNPDELTTFFFHEYGLNFPEDGLYTMLNTFQENPGLSCAFVQASIEGWRYAFSQPEEALDILMNYIKEAHIPASRIHQKWMLERMKDLILPQDSKVAVGALPKAGYESVAAELKQSGLIDDIPEFDSFYMNCRSHDET